MVIINVSGISKATKGADNAYIGMQFCFCDGDNACN
jgi:hypothetical protein